MNLLDLQYEFELEYFWLESRDLDDVELTEFVRDQILALIAEATELLNSFHWKSWDSKVGSLDIEHSREELIDILFFWLNLANILGLDRKAIEQLYLAKRDKVINRVKTGQVGETR